MAMENDAAPTGATELKEREVTEVRNELGDLVSELGRRKRSWFDLRAHVRHHPVVLIGALVAGSAVLATVVAMAVARRRQQHGTAYKLAQLREATRRMIAHPERVAARESSGWRRAASATAATAATTLARKYIRERAGQR